MGLNEYFPFIEQDFEMSPVNPYSKYQLDAM